METQNKTVSNNTVVAYTPLPRGTVIRTHVIDTDPPKTKIFIIVGYYENYVVTVYFNSEINQFINYSQELQVLHLYFEAKTRSYLTKNCYCDCSTISLKNKDELHKSVREIPDIHIGNLSKEDLDTVMITLKNSPKIKGVQKKRYGFYEYHTTD